MFSKIKLRYLVVMILLFGACKTQFFVPDEITAQKMGISLKELNTGRELYISRCRGCHNLHRPDQFSFGQWTEIMKSMSEEAELTESEKNNILLFLKAYAKQ